MTKGLGEDSTNLLLARLYSNRKPTHVNISGPTWRLLLLFFFPLSKSQSFFFLREDLKKLRIRIVLP